MLHLLVNSKTLWKYKVTYNFFILSTFLHSTWRLLCCSVSCHVWLFATPWTAARRLLHPPLSHRVCSNSCPLSQWCYVTISSFAAPFSFCLQSFPALRSFPVSRLFESGGQSIGASSSASVFPGFSGLISFDFQDWFPLGLTGLISLVSKRLSRVFSSTANR